ncbi:Crp/Fnr family transcriptional regulator [Ruminococcus sp.]|uniref:Crp/Fnr family transcriptional regulator n=1 Tax=Ruminococcus sp. TaxID=41978 RepID=UPI00258C8937|nr:Crp/Fnr family transcriptional regulator [Ruminococcus sp.]MCR5021295.1 Crp/Fnr family transcriptional regulator [Ruminococcus sp.]
MGSTQEILNTLLPFWDGIEESDRSLICENTVSHSFTTGETIHRGQDCSGVIIVRSGCLRVYILSENGKDITLYRLFPGDICMLSASCVLDSITFDVSIDAEENSRCIIIGGSVFDTLSKKYKDIRIFSLETAVSRFSDVMWVMQQILFMSMDKRLAVFLIDEAARNKTDEIMLTHEQIARYIGSAREVVSRTLKYLSSEGLVEVSRKGIRIIDKAGLRELTN